MSIVGAVVVPIGGLILLFTLPAFRGLLDRMHAMADSRHTSGD